MNDNLVIWNAIKTPPPHALKEIQAGRLKGKSDINPQWRLEAMTSTFGPVGVGWRYFINKYWLEPVCDGQIVAFAEVSLYIKWAGEWSEAIPGIGGNMLIENERNGPHVNDECYKMAVTDALSVAMKALGMAADVYAGMMDGSKYSRPTLVRPEGEAAPGQPVGPPLDRPQTNGDNMTVTWGAAKGDKPASEWHGKTFQQVWDSGSKGHQYLHWVAESSNLNANTKKAVRSFLDRQKKEPVYATTDEIVSFRSAYELCGLDLGVLGETIRKFPEGEVPKEWLDHQWERLTEKFPDLLAIPPDEEPEPAPSGYPTPMRDDDDLFPA